MIRLTRSHFFIAAAAIAAMLLVGCSSTPVAQDSPTPTGETPGATAHGR